MIPLGPLELPGWVEFTAERSGLSPRRFEATDGGAQLRAVFYVDRRERILCPANSPYLALAFGSSRQRASARRAAWLALAEPLVEEMARRGVANFLRLPPDVDDLRPWLWHGFVVRPTYTYLVDLPLDADLVTPEARRVASRAATSGMRVERVDDARLVSACLAESETRKRFSFAVDEPRLRLAIRLIGLEGLRMYVCFDARGRPAATTVFLHAPGSRALEWMAGTGTAALANGATYLLMRESLADLAASGASGVDMCGANLRQVAAFKSRWGGRLAGAHSVRSYSARAAARFASDWRSASVPSVVERWRTGSATAARSSHASRQNG